MKFSSNQFESQLNSIIEKRRKVQKRHFNKSNANGQHAQEKLPNVSYNLPLCQEPVKSHKPECTYTGNENTLYGAPKPHMRVCGINRLYTCIEKNICKSMTYTKTCIMWHIFTNYLFINISL